MGPLDKALGVSPQALALRSKRMEVLSANIANASTPGYKARDIDFAGVMKAAQGEQSGLQRTHSDHFSTSGTSAADAQMMYRMPSQVSMDGNTVETHREHAAFMDNAVRYQASLNFLDGRLASLRLAIRGQS